MQSVGYFSVGILCKQNVNKPIVYIQTASSSGDPHVHVIKDVKATDEGLYTCIAGNVLGQATASAYLEVNAASRLGPGLGIGLFSMARLLL